MVQKTRYCFLLLSGAFRDFFMFKKNIIIKSLLTLLLLSPLFATAGISEAVTFLQSQTPDAWNTQALVAVGEIPPSLDHLKSVSGTLATDYAKTVLAVVAAGENPKTFGNIDYVAKLRTFFSNDQMGDETLLNDDFWSILALCSVNECDSLEVTEAKDFILSNQNADGGWGYSVGGTSDSNDTAAAIMALSEAGVSSSNSAISGAVSYLQNIQNDDGGFGWEVSSDSDSGSGAWVIMALNKLGIDASTWSKGSADPKSHLLSLQDDDGGFWWVEEDGSDFNNKAMTSYAVIALENKSFPLAYLQNDNSDTQGFLIRIEGKDKTVCSARVEGPSALDLVKNAAEICSYTYNIEDTAYGPYLNRINKDEAEGASGWMYFVNNESLLVGMADYVMQEGDELLLYYGGWGLTPSRARMTKTAWQSGESVVIKAESFLDGQWKALPEASILGLPQDYETNITGELSLALTDGRYTVWLEKEGHVRSEKITFTVGSGVEQSVDLTVEITSGGVDVIGEAIIFTVSPNSLDFGSMQAGLRSADSLTLKNDGTVSLDLSADVQGDKVFHDHLELAGEDWQSYQEIVNAGTNKDLEVALDIPNTYIGSGVKNADLIIWASPK